MSLVDALLLEPYRDPREIYIALRSDGLKGSGTIDDPFDGSTRQAASLAVASFSSTGSQGRESIVTASASLGLVNGDVVVINGVTGTGAAYWNGTFPVFNVSVAGGTVTFSYWVKRNGSVLAPDPVPLPASGDTITVAKLLFLFDDRMRQLAALQDTTGHVHLGPGIFETRGYSDATGGRPQTWQPKKRMKFRGSGMDVTTLKLVYCDIQDGNYFAIGTGYGHLNLVDYAEVSDLTVNSDLPNQPLTRGFDYARIACSAVSLTGVFCRISRVKAIHWGTQSPTEAFVLGAVGAHPDYAQFEMVNQVIEDCVCVQPNESNRYTSTVIHTGGGLDPVTGRHVYSRGSILRRNFVDCLFSAGRSSFTHIVQQVSEVSDTAGRVWLVQTKTPHGKTTGSRGYISDVSASDSVWNDYFEFEHVNDTTLKVTFPSGVALPIPTDHDLILGTGYNGLSVGATRACLVEENVVVNTAFGGPYQDTGHTKEIIVRRNTYKNVSNGPYITNGNVFPIPLAIKSLEHLGGGVAEATTFVDHGFVDTLQVKILLASPNNYNGAFPITNVTSNSFQYVMISPPTGDGTGGIAERLVASLTALSHIGGGVARATTSILDHFIVVGDRIKVSNATPTDFNGFFEVTAVDTNAGTFDYKMTTTPSPGVIAQNPTFQRVWGIDRLVVEDNLIELRLLASGEYGTPSGIGLGDAYGVQPPFGPPPYTHGEVIIRNNVIQMLDGQTDSGAGAWAMLLNGAKNLVVENNIIDVPNADPIREWRCGTLRFFNNTTAAGAVIQGANGETLFKHGGLELEIEDAFLISI